MCLQYTRMPVLVIIQRQAVVAYEVNSLYIYLRPPPTIKSVLRALYQCKTSVLLSR